MFKCHYFCKRKHSRWARHTSGGKCRKITSVLGGRSLRGLKRGVVYCVGRGYRVMRSTRLPLGGVILSGKKLTSVSNSCVRWAYVWSTSEKPRGMKSELDLNRAVGKSWNSFVSSGSVWSTVRDRSFCRYLSAFKGSVWAFSSNLYLRMRYLQCRSRYSLEGRHSFRDQKSSNLILGELDFPGFPPKR